MSAAKRPIYRKSPRKKSPAKQAQIHLDEFEFRASQNVLPDEFAIPTVSKKRRRTNGSVGKKNVQQPAAEKVARSMKPDTNIQDAETDIGSPTPAGRTSLDNSFQESPVSYAFSETKIRDPQKNSRVTTPKQRVSSALKGEDSSKRLSVAARQSKKSIKPKVLPAVHTDDPFQLTQQVVERPDGAKYFGLEEENVGPIFLTRFQTRQISSDNSQSDDEATPRSPSFSRPMVMTAARKAGATFERKYLARNLSVKAKQTLKSATSAGTVEIRNVGEMDVEDSPASTNLQVLTDNHVAVYRQFAESPLNVGERSTRIHASNAEPQCLPTADEGNAVSPSSRGSNAERRVGAGSPRMPTADIQAVSSPSLITKKSAVSALQTAVTPERSRSVLKQHHRSVRSSARLREKLPVVAVTPPKGNDLPWTNSQLQKAQNTEATFAQLDRETLDTSVVTRQDGRSSAAGAAHSSYFGLEPELLTPVRSPAIERGGFGKPLHSSESGAAATINSTEANKSKENAGKSTIAASSNDDYPTFSATITGVTNNQSSFSISSSQGFEVTSAEQSGQPSSDLITRISSPRAVVTETTPEEVSTIPEREMRTKPTRRSSPRIAMKPIPVTEPRPSARTRTSRLSSEANTAVQRKRKPANVRDPARSESRRRKSRRLEAKASDSSSSVHTDVVRSQPNQHENEILIGDVTNIADNIDQGSTGAYARPHLPRTETKSANAAAEEVTPSMKAESTRLKEGGTSGLMSIKRKALLKGVSNDTQLTENMSVPGNAKLRRLESVVAASVNVETASGGIAVNTVVSSHRPDIETLNSILFGTPDKAPQGLAAGAEGQKTPVSGVPSMGNRTNPRSSARQAARSSERLKGHSPARTASRRSPRIRAERPAQKSPCGDQAASGKKGIMGGAGLSSRDGAEKTSTSHPTKAAGRASGSDDGQFEASGAPLAYGQMTSGTQLSSSNVRETPTPEPSIRSQIVEHTENALPHVADEVFADKSDQRVPPKRRTQSSAVTAKERVVTTADASAQTSVPISQPHTPSLSAKVPVSPSSKKPAASIDHTADSVLVRARVAAESTSRIDEAILFLRRQCTEEEQRRVADVILSCMVHVEPVCQKVSCKATVITPKKFTETGVQYSPVDGLSSESKQSSSTTQDQPETAAVPLLRSPEVNTTFPVVDSDSSELKDQQASVVQTKRSTSPGVSQPLRVGLLECDKIETADERNGEVGNVVKESQSPLPPHGLDSEDICAAQNLDFASQNSPPSTSGREDNQENGGLSCSEDVDAALLETAAELDACQNDQSSATSESFLSRFDTTKPTVVPGTSLTESQMEAVLDKMTELPRNLSDLPGFSGAVPLGSQFTRPFRAPGPAIRSANITAHSVRAPESQEISPLPVVFTTSQLANWEISERTQFVNLLETALPGSRMVSTFADGASGQFVTHVIVESRRAKDGNAYCLRTLKALMAFAKGVPVVSKSWAVECIRRGQVVAWVEHEVVGASSAPTLNAIESDPGFHLVHRRPVVGLLAGYHFFLIPDLAKATDIPMSNMNSLIRYAGGAVVDREADLKELSNRGQKTVVLCYGFRRSDREERAMCHEIARRTGAVPVDREWLLQGISEGQLSHIQAAALCSPRLTG